MGDDHYLEVISLIERLHRQFLGLVKIELDSWRIHDINNVQAMLLFNMGEQEISVGELIRDAVAAQYGLKGKGIEMRPMNSAEREAQTKTAARKSEKK